MHSLSSYQGGLKWFRGAKKIPGGLKPPWHPTSRAYGLGSKNEISNTFKRAKKADIKTNKARKRKAAEETHEVECKRKLLRESMASMTKEADK